MFDASPKGTCATYPGKVIKVLPTFRIPSSCLALTQADTPHTHTHTSILFLAYLLLFNWLQRWKNHKKKKQAGPGGTRQAAPTKQKKTN